MNIIEKYLVLVTRDLCDIESILNKTKACVSGVEAGLNVSYKSFIVMIVCWKTECFKNRCILRVVTADHFQHQFTGQEFPSGPELEDCFELCIGSY